MRAANPIYDVVFKFLLGDKKIAKLIISKIIGQDIIELDFAPTFPKEFRMIIRRLVKAGAEIELCKKMDIEDDVLSEFAAMERTISDKAKQLEESQRKIDENRRTIDENRKTIDLAIDLLVKQGMTEAEAKKQLGIK